VTVICGLLGAVGDDDEGAGVPVVLGALVVDPAVLMGGRTTTGEWPPHAPASNPSSPSTPTPKAVEPGLARPRLVIATSAPTKFSVSRMGAGD
jgi:hypothetical protein